MQDRVGGKLIGNENHLVSSGAFTQADCDFLTNSRYFFDQVDDLIAARLERQHVIGRTPVTLVISQAVLFRRLARLR